MLQTKPTPAPISLKVRRHQGRSAIVDNRSKYQTNPITTIPISHTMQAQNVRLEAISAKTDLDPDERGS